MSINEPIKRSIKEKIIKLYESLEQSSPWLQKYGVIVSVLIFTIATSWWADSLPIHSIDESNVTSLIISTLLITLSLFMFNRYKNSLCSTTIINKQIFQPHNAVVTLLSKESKDKEFSFLKQLTIDLEKDISTDGVASQSNWRQQLRALSLNKSLTNLYVISSRESKEQFFKFEEMIKHYRPNLIIKHITPNGVNFEELKEVYDAISEAIRHARNDNFNLVDIAIDITGGQKTASIAAANFTLEHKDLEFFYVVSGERLEVISYNAISNKSEAPAS